MRNEENVSGRKQEAQARAAQVAAIRAAQQRKERRTRLLLIGGVVLLVGVLVTAAILVISAELRDRAALEEAAAQPIEGVSETTDLPRGHVPTPEPTAEAAGTLLPPVGGDHDPVWQNCGVYTEPILSKHAVHSLEHGAVWITYQPGLAADEVAQLERLMEGRSYTLLSPFEDQASPIVLTAWGVQLELDDASDPRAEVFLERYVQGEQTPEPGAACTGGIGEPA
jgi:hypothetical protein